jgi:plastocyanin
MASAVDEAPPTATESTANAFALDERLAALGGLGLDQLRAEWRRLHRAAPPVRLSRDLLLRSIAHRLQEDAFGGLGPAARRRLAGLARGVAKGEPAPAPAAVRLKPGTTLVREWHGRTHTVLVLADGGFECQGRRYSSLTELARAITGARWSGPRFFGLRRGIRPAGAHAEADRGGDA